MNLTKWFVMFVFMIAMAGAVIAESSVNDTNNVNDTDDNVTHAQALNVRYDHLQCKVAFTNVQIDILKKYTSVNQTENKDKLVADMTSLKTYVLNIDKDGFDNYTSQVVRPDLQKATQDLNSAKANFKQYNLTNASRTALMTDLKEAIKTYSNCTSDKELKMANVMEKHMENWNRQLGKITDKINKKNITTANMTQIMDEIDARNAKLRELIAAGNITTLKEFMKAYQESQFHYMARFEIARLEGYKDKLGPLADKYNMSGKLHEIDNRISDAAKYAKEGYKYNDGDREKVWQNIKNASKDIKDAAKGINDERIKERQGKMQDKQQQMQDRQKRGPGKMNGSNNDNNSGEGN